MPTPSKTQKIQQVVSHFVGANQKLGTQIMAAIAAAKSQRNPSPDQIIAKFTTDPALQAKIKTFIAKVRGGHNLPSLVGFHIADSQQAQATAEAAQMYRGVVQHILAS